MSETGQKTQYVLLVHGTFAASDLDRGGSWWQTGSSAAESLRQSLGAGYVVNPEEVTVRSAPVPVSESVFHWSGRNSEHARRLAAERLCERLAWFNGKDLEFHVVAHSHGGSVLWEALQLAQKSWKKNGGNGEKPLKNLVSWTTVGTPFLHFVPRLSGLAAVLMLAMTLLVFSFQWRWLTEYWNLARQLEDISPWTCLFAFSLTYSAWILSPFTILLFAYRCFKVSASQTLETRYAEIRRLELARLRDSAIAILIPILLLIPWLIPSLSEIRA